MTVTFLSLALLSATLAPAQTPEPAPPGIRVHPYTAASRSYDANAFWLESDKGLVLIDALLLKSDARLLAATMKATGKPLAGILLTHPHLDHFGGLRTVVDAMGPVPVYATRATVDGIKPTHDKAMAAGWPQGYGDDYDRSPYLPDTMVEPGAILDLAGMRFEVRDYGPMEALNNSVIHNLDLNILFTGDATASHAALYVGEGRSLQALDVLERMLKDFGGVRRVYSGHYAPASIAPLIAQNIEEIRYYRSVVAAQFSDPSRVTEKGELTEAARKDAARAIAMRMREDATYGLDPMSMALMNLGGLEPELFAEMKKSRVQPMRKAVQDGLHRLDFIVGGWSGRLTAPARSKAAEPAPPDIRLGYGAGSRYIEGEARISGYGYRIVISYDVFQKSYRLSFIDDVSGLLDVYEGGFDPNGALIVSNLKSGTHYVAGQDKVHTRLTLKPEPNDLWQWRIEESRDAGRTWSHRQTFAAERRVP